MELSLLQVRDYMSWPVVTIPSGSTADLAYGTMQRHGISAMPVVDSSGAVLGLISRSDLLAIGKAVAEREEDAPKRVFRLFSGEVVDDLMTRTLIRVSPTGTFLDACRLMVENNVHRVVVEAGGQLAGILSTHDVMYAIRDLRFEKPIDLVKSDIVMTIDVGDSYENGVGRLREAGIQGLVVTENDWPVGVFSQTDALAHRGEAADTLIELVMDPALICLPKDTPLFRAAQQAIRMRTRRIVVSHHRAMHGVVSGLDFARFFVNPPEPHSETQYRSARG